jgi:DNA-binding winged helix-turn-helix (wHTH) protein
LLLLSKNNHIIKDITKSANVTAKANVLRVFVFSFKSYVLYDKIKNIPKKGIKIKADNNIEIYNKKFLQQIISNTNTKKTNIK